MIYIDPPYNTGKDFIYKDKFGDTIANYKEITSQTTKSNAEHMGKYHTNWLNMMYSRLKLAHNLLTEDGVIFISIDDNEVHNLRKLCDEVFGEENFINCICVKMSHLSGMKMAHKDKKVPKIKEYIIIYSKQRDFIKLNPIYIKGNWSDVLNRYVSFIEKPNNDISSWYRVNLNEKLKSLNINKVDEEDFKIKNSHLIFRTATNDSISNYPKDDKFYNIITPTGLEKLIFNSEEVLLAKNKLQNINGNYIPVETIGDMWIDIGINNLHKEGFVSFPNGKKPLKLIKRLIDIIINEDDIILDFFSGSATTAHAVMQLNKEDGGNRKFIMVQLPELTDEKSEAYKAGYKNICEIGKERIRRAGKQLVEDMEDPTTLDIGFKVLKLDTSNITEWDDTPILETDKQLIINTIEQRLDKVLEGIKSDRSKLDVVFEIMMKLGVPFHIPLTQTDINGKLMFVLGDFLLLICLEDKITFDDVKAMCDEAPAMLVCSENGFADSCVMANVYYHMKKLEIDIKLI